MEEKLLSDPETEEVSEASSSESKVGRRRGVKAPAPPRVNKSTQHQSSLTTCSDNRCVYAGTYCRFSHFPYYYYLRQLK